MEIERKFLITSLPEGLEQFPHTRLEQAYISTEPVIRVRRDGERFVLTCKGPGLLEREEFEQELTEASYCRLLAKTEGIPIVKERYRIPWQEHTIELDVFSEPFAPLVVAEVEFAHREAAERFTPPPWFGAEVTGDPGYTNASLSRRAFRDGPAQIRPGRYRHFKGGMYQVLFTARHSETQEPMVVYQALYGQRGIWVRPAAMWSEEVDRDGYRGPRFVPVEL